LLYIFVVELMPNDLGTYGDPGVDADAWIKKALDSSQAANRNTGPAGTVKASTGDEDGNALYIYIAFSILVALAFYFNIFKTLIPTVLILANLF
jgi:hypothetical protein